MNNNASKTYISFVPNTIVFGVSCIVNCNRLFGSGRLGEWPQQSNDRVLNETILVQRQIGHKHSDQVQWKTVQFKQMQVQVIHYFYLINPSHLSSFIQDPFYLDGIKVDKYGTKAEPYVVKTLADNRIIGCVCKLSKRSRFNNEFDEINQQLIVTQ